MLIFLLFYVSSATEILRPRGVSVSNSVLYDPDKEFTCFDGSNVMPFSYVNDDYCDCHDGSDEPGTAACPNGSFYCMNAGHVPSYIPSSRVNDGICDCCDTSDEYGGHASCVNMCQELGRAAREESLKLIEMQQKGYEIRLQLKEKGQQAKQEMKKRLEEMEARKEEYLLVTEEKRKIKEEAEIPEREALEVYRQKEEEERKQREAEEEEKRKQEATEAFRNLDVNEDDTLDVSELQTHVRFDQNRDGAVSEEEARFFLNNQDSMSFDEFLSTGWALMKSYYQLSDSGVYVPPQQTEEKQPESEEVHKEELPEEEYDEDMSETEMVDDRDDDDEDDEHDDDIDDSDDEYDRAPEESEYTEDKPTEGEEEQTEVDDKYDEETKRLIEIANKARDEFETADREARDLDREIKDLQNTLEKNWGPNDEFQPLQGECFDYTDREYTYTLCPFDKVIQKPKHGGSETKLGVWGEWDGPEGNKYSKMKYDRGIQCWNGPMRSAEVHLSCDIENKITSVTEPSRCEYVLLFSTPAICDKPEQILDHVHTEL